MAIRIFIGSEPKTAIARDVLKYSILKHTSTDIDFQPLEGSESWTKKATTGVNSVVGTGFSLLRWDIPERCNYEGYAIYLDADMLVFDDIKDLWESDVKYPNENCSVWCTYQRDKWSPTKDVPQSAVMLIDCARAKTNQPSLDAILYYLHDAKQEDRTNYVKVMYGYKHQNKPQKIHTKWNRLNKYIPEKTSLLHYTKEPQQPWYNPKHAFREDWEKVLVEAIQEGFITKNRIQAALECFVPHDHSFRGQGLHPYYRKLLQ